MTTGVQVKRLMMAVYVWWSCRLINGRATATLHTVTIQANSHRLPFDNGKM